MKSFKNVIALSLLFVLLCSAVAFAGHYWRCSFCGRGVSADSCPPTGKCDKSPWGTHNWEMQK